MSKYLTKTLHQQMYAQAYARHVEAVRRGIDHDRLENMFPSTDTTPGGRGCGSPLGTGFAVEKPKETS
jgi:hypothetical protein